MKLERKSEGMMIYIARFLLAACALGAGVSLANAQVGQDHAAHHPGNQAPTHGRPAPPASGMPTMGGKGRMMPMPEMMQIMHRMMTACGVPDRGNPAMSGLQHIEGQLAYYKAELGITDAQLPQWNALADAVRASAKTLQQAHLQAVHPAASLSAPEQMARRMSMLPLLIEAQKSVEGPLMALYGALSAEQKKTADAFMAEHLEALQASEL